MTTITADDAIVTKYAADMLSGDVFRRHATSARSIMGYQPPANITRLTTAMRAIATFTHLYGTPKTVRLAQAMIAAMRPGQTWGHMQAALYDAAADVIGSQTFDVIRSAGPNPGRASDNLLTFTLREVLLVSNLLRECIGDPRIGWVEQRLIAQSF